MSQVQFRAFCLLVIYAVQRYVRIGEAVTRFLFRNLLVDIRMTFEYARKCRLLVDADIKDEYRAAVQAARFPERKALKATFLRSFPRAAPRRRSFSHRRVDSFRFHQKS